jgi:uncharacterized protein YndB with AHSA1/START domain
LLLIAFLLPSERRIEASVKIDAPMQIVFDQVNDLRNWEAWSPWKKMDPLMEMSYSNPPSGKGAFLKWRSTDPRIGRGKLILTEVIPNQKIGTAMDFEKEQDNTAEFTFEEEKNTVKVTWSMIHRVGGNPISKYGLLFQTGKLRKVFDDGLFAIKIQSENR